MINFDALELKELSEFRGGLGTVKARMFDDDNGKIMRATLEKGVSIGVHTHTTNSEIVYVISGTAKFTLNGKDEIVRAGECHYCPKGETHTVINEFDEPLVMFCCIPNQ